jgi:DNA-binding transcriptional LysR family regulator
VERIGASGRLDVSVTPMNFERLRYLAAVARTGSVRAAAAQLNVTPGAVSKGLARLEQEAGVPLLVPLGRGVELTDEGRWLAGRADHLVGEFASLASDLSDRQGRTTELCIATYDVFVELLPGLIVRQFLPGVPLSVRERWPGDLEQAVAKARTDVGITLTPVETEGVIHREVAKVDLGIFVRRGAFVGASLAELPFAVAAHPVSGAVASFGPLDGWPADAPPRRVMLRSSAFEARLGAARDGVAAILAPRFVVERHNRMVTAAHRLEPWSGTAPTRMRRRVHVAMRPHSSPELAQRVDAVAAAVAALCDV